MNILFLTSGLEISHDGVGDYTRLLGKACTSFGHSVSIIALNDSKLDRISEGNFDGVKYLRIPSTMNWADKWQFAAKFAPPNTFDWISLQFVPYAFGRRGIFGEFSKGVIKFTRGRNIHIKFHEIWIGQYPKAPIKEMLLGYIQKKLVKQLVSKLSPKKIHYTNAGSKIRLAQAGIPSKYLPIFSNIPLNPNIEKDWIIKNLIKAKKSPPDYCSNRFMFFGFFGSIHHNWPARQLLERLRMYTTARSKRPALLHAGILPQRRNRWREIQKNYSGDWLIHSFGQLSDENVSNYLHGLSFGITSTPWDLVGKSGTIAAMVEHGVPVIINVEGGSPGAPLVIQKKFKSLILKADEHLLLKLPSYLHQKPFDDNLSQVTKQFIADLHSA